MEPNPSDLNRSVREWRDGLAQAGTLRVEELDELEHHLRDSMVQLQASALSDEERFFLAARRLGHGDTLVGEFAKADPSRIWKSRLVWMLTGLLLYQVVGNLLGMLPFLLGLPSWADPQGSEHWSALLAIVMGCIGRITPFLVFYWLGITKTESLVRWTRCGLRHPVMTVAVMIFLGFVAAYPWWLRQLGGAIPALVWWSIGLNLLWYGLLSIMIVFLARRLRPPTVAT